MDHELASIDLDLAPNEASGLLPVADRPLLETHGWDQAFWVVLDEGPVERSVAVVGHDAGAEVGAGWSIERLHAIVEGDQVKTEDAEAVARHDGWVYVFGSQFGKKEGPLQPKRSFVARFREAEVRHVLEPPAATLAVARPPFLLHRLVNDALRDGGPDPVRLGPRSHQALIAATRARGRAEVRDDDLPLNVEGAAFRDDGSLVLGLRFPTAADGRPLLVELDGIQRLFEPGGGTTGGARLLGPGRGRPRRDHGRGPRHDAARRRAARGHRQHRRPGEGQRAAGGLPRGRPHHGHPLALPAPRRPPFRAPGPRAGP